MVAYDQDLAEAFGINNKDDFKKFYTILHDLYLSGGQCNANNVNQDDAAQYDQYNQDGNYNQYNQDGNYDQDGNYNQDAEDQDAEAENEAEDNEGEQEGEQEGQEDGGEGQRLRRRLQDDEENQDAQDQDAQDQDAQDQNQDAQNQNAQGQQGYSVANVVRNCGSVFQAYGIDLSNVNMDEDNDDLDDALKTLSINIQIEKALENGALDNYNYNFANNGQDGDQGNDDQFYNIIQTLGIDADDLDDDDINEIKAALAVQSGAFDEYIQNNAAFGTYIDDWEGTMQNFFYSLGMEDVNLQDLSPYTTAAIYNKEWLNEEYGCQVAMIQQFGKSQAVNYGYVDYQDIVDNSDINANAADYFNAAVSQFTTGQTVGIVVGVLAAVSILLCAAFVCGKNEGLSSRSSRNEPLWRGTAV